MRLYQPSAILFVNDPERDVTRAEAALALELLPGRGLQVAADRLRITLTTARTHLAHVFEKTGTTRQAELVRLILQSAGSLDRMTIIRPLENAMGPRADLEAACGAPADPSALLHFPRVTRESGREFSSAPKIGSLVD